MQDFNLYLKNLIKIPKGSNISKLYENIFNTADSLAAYETGLYRHKLMAEMMHNTLKPNTKITTMAYKLVKYRQNRINFHILKMIKLLEFSQKKEYTF